MRRGGPRPRINLNRLRKSVLRRWRFKAQARCFAVKIHAMRIAGLKSDVTALRHVPTEVVHLYSITLSANTETASGIDNPSALAVFKLRTK